MFIQFKKNILKKFQTNSEYLMKFNKNNILSKLILGKLKNIIIFQLINKY